MQGIKSKKPIRIGQNEHFITLDQLVGVGGDANTHPLSMRCPHCSHIGTFVASKGKTVGLTIDSGPVGSLLLSIHSCPNSQCRRVVFTVTQGIVVLFSFPSERIDFDATGVPERVVSTLIEAIECHANSCFRAAGIMVRRTLEEVCADKNAKGGDLYKRLEALSAIITVPKELVAAMNELRLLGNDAAHIEAKTYDDIGSPEIEAGIALAKEIIKATYQYSDLVSKLNALKKKPPTAA